MNRKIDSPADGQDGTLTQAHLGNTLVPAYWNVSHQFPESIQIEGMIVASLDRLYSSLAPNIP